MPNVAGSLGEALDCLEKDHEFLLKGDVFTEDFLDMWINLQDGQGSEPGAAAASPDGVRALLRHLRRGGSRRAGRSIEKIARPVSYTGSTQSGARQAFTVATKSRQVDFRVASMQLLKSSFSLPGQLSTLQRV